MRAALAAVMFSAFFLPLVGACGVEPTPTPEPELAYEDILEETDAHLLSFQTARFRLIDEMESGAPFFGQTLQSVDGQVVTPDRAQITASVESILGFLEIGIITIGDDAFMQLTSGAAWRPLPPDQLPFNLSNVGRTLSDMLPKIQGGEVIGREIANDAESIKIEGDIVSDDLTGLIPAADPGHPIDLTVWVSAADRSLQQIRIVGAVFDEDAPGTSRLIILSDYDLPVEIDAPPIATEP